MMRFLVLAAIAASFSVPAWAVEVKAPLERIISDYIVPASAQFADTAASLPDAVMSVCQAPGEGTVASLEKVYAQTVFDFSRIHFLRFGPLIENDRLSRLAFLPDPRGIGQRQIRKVFASRDAGVLSPDSLRSKSVALQGLTAFQLIAFDKNGSIVLGAPGENKDFTCGYAAAIAQNVAAIAESVARDWANPDGYRALLLSAGPDNERFRTTKEAVETVFNGLVTGLIVARDQNILPALGSSEAKAKPRRFPFARSGNSILFLKGELSGLREALFSMNLQDLTPEDFQWIFGSLSFEFANGENLLEQLKPPLRETLGEDGSYAKVSLLAITIKSIRDTLALELAGALALSGGFNALDGD